MRCRLPVVLQAAFLLAALAPSTPARAAADDASPVSVKPQELTDKVVHNPGMGWVLYENYPLDQDPHGSSTMLTLPAENFREVDAAALMFSWQDVETSEGDYDWSKVDEAYDHWSQRGKEIQLRVSATSLMWWAGRNPPAGTGAPQYVLDKLAPHQKQTRTLQGVSYAVEDARNECYQQRLVAFLHALDAHFDAARPVTLIDLRGFGVWGEWHSGFQYADLEQRRGALTQIIDLWSDALPSRTLALSASYDPDGPKDLYAGPTDKFVAKYTANYRDFIHYSAFDHALTRPNVTFRRDGCGGAVHSNERKLIDAAFTAGRGQIVSEFVDGYAQSKAGGRDWVSWKIDDALSLHPNYINLLGWQGADAQAFIRECPDLIAHGLRRMGYRLLPTRVTYPRQAKQGQRVASDITWENRGVGRAPRDFQLQWLLLDASSAVAAKSAPTRLPTSNWIAGEQYAVAVPATFTGAPPGKYRLAVQLLDAATGRTIALPLAERNDSRRYELGDLEIVAP